MSAEPSVAGGQSRRGMLRTGARHAEGLLIDAGEIATDCRPGR